MQKSRAVRQSTDDGEMNLALGRVLLRTEQPSRAVVFLEKAAELLDDHPEPHHTLGVALSAVGDMDKARDAFGKAVQAAPDETALLVSFGRACVDTARYDDARSSLERALSKSSEVTLSRTSSGLITVTPSSNWNRAPRAWNRRWKMHWIW